MDEYNIDDSLRDLGVETEISQSTVAEVSEEMFSDESVSEILENNGFSAENAAHEYINLNSLENTDAMESRSEGQSDAEEEVTEETSEELQTKNTVTENTIPEDALIPLNSPTLLVDESTTRFSGAEWFKEIQKKRIIIAGVGGIGSNLAFQLARMIPANITLYDDDMVEMVNMAGQLYKYSDIGQYKVDAIAGMISHYTAMKQVNAIRSKFTSDTETGDIMMCGFDNMKARKTFFQSWMRHVNNTSNKKDCLYMDGRLSMDTLQIFCLRGNDDYSINRYAKEYLFDDSEAEATVCSMKQTTYLACMIGSFMVNIFTNFVANSLDPIIPYDTPFFTEYDAQNMIFKVDE